MKNININSLLSINNPKRIDIRSNYNFINGHIPGSINITSSELLNNYKKYLNKNETYYIYCQSGSRSKLIVNELSKLGFKVININGGYNAYLFRY